VGPCTTRAVGLLASGPLSFSRGASSQREPAPNMSSAFLGFGFRVRVKGLGLGLTLDHLPTFARPEPAPHLAQ